LILLLQIETAREGKQLFEYLEKHHAFKIEDLDTLYDYAKFQYECGNYSGKNINILSIVTRYCIIHRWVKTQLW